MGRWVFAIPILLITSALFIVGILLGESFSAPVSLVHWFIPFVPLAFYVFFLFIADCKNHTSQIIYNHGKGHMTVCHRNIHEVPYLKYSGKKQEKLGHLTIIESGGFEHKYFVWDGNILDPIIICPGMYKERIINNSIVRANLSRYTYQQLPLNIQRKLDDMAKTRSENRDFTKRFDKHKTPILYGITADLDGSSTPANLELEDQVRFLNEQLTMYKESNDKMRDHIRGEKDMKKRDFWKVGTELRPVDTE